MVLWLWRTGPDLGQTWDNTGTDLGQTCDSTGTGLWLHWDRPGTGLSQVCSSSAQIEPFLSALSYCPVLSSTVQHCLEYLGFADAFSIDGERSCSSTPSS